MWSYTALLDVEIKEIASFEEDYTNNKQLRHLNIDKKIDTIYNEPVILESLKHSPTKIREWLIWLTNKHLVERLWS